MSTPQQNYSNHLRFHPLFHFIGIPILAINVIVRIVQAVRTPSLATFWEVAVAAAILIALFLTRFYALSVQNRVIRIEERVRLERVLPPDLRGRIADIRTSHLIALRFAPDDELPELTRAILAGDLQEPKAIKQRIRNWRADKLRV